MFKESDGKCLVCASELNYKKYHEGGIIKKIDREVLKWSKQDFKTTYLFVSAMIARTDTTRAVSYIARMIVCVDNRPTIAIETRIGTECSND